MKHDYHRVLRSFFRLAVAAIAACALALPVAPACFAFATDSPDAEDAQASQAAPQAAPQSSQGAPQLASDEHAGDSDQQRVVRVGYMDSPGVLSRDENGTFSGYTYDYLVQVAQYTGWSYEFVEAPGETINDQASNLVDMLLNGEVDLEGSMSYSQDLAQLFEYPQNSYGTVHTALFAPNGTGTLTQTNLFTRRELTVAAYKSANLRRKELQYFCDTNGIELTVVDYESMDELESHTLSGEVDAFLDVDINVRDAFHIVATFSARPYFFAAPKGQRGIIDELDKAIENINSGNPTLQATLYSTYFLKPDADLSLTDEELAFARSHKPLRVGIVSEKAPIQSFDEVTGELKGMTRGVLNYLEQHVGLSFEIVPISPSDNTAQAIADADVDLVAGIDAKYSVASSLGLSLTAPYLSSSSLIVYNSHVSPDDLEDARLAVPWELSALAEQHENIQIYADLKSCFQAVDSGRADHTYASSYTAPYYLNMTDSTNLLTLPMTSQSVETAFGLVRPVEPELLLVINKALRSLPATEYDSIAYDNALLTQDEQLGQFIRDHLAQIALALVGVLMVIIVLLALYLRTRTKAASAMREENRRFQKIYSLSNEQFFEYTIRSDRLMVSLPKNPDAPPDSAFDNDVQSDEGQAYRIIENARESILTHDGPEMMSALTDPKNAVNDFCFKHPEESDDQAHWVRITAHFVDDDAGNHVSVIGKITNVDDEMREKIDLSQRALHDGLTGLLNWEAFQAQAATLLSNGNAGALLVIDADDFKLVNDTYGHLTGDAALRHAADALRQAFRPRDLVGRLGGDEFAVCLDGDITHDLLEERCRTLVERGVTFRSDEGRERTLTLSVGCVELNGARPKYADAYQAADRALYRAKADGKDRFVVTPYPIDSE